MAESAVDDVTPDRPERCQVKIEGPYNRDYREPDQRGVWLYTLYITTLERAGDFLQLYASAGVHLRLPEPGWWWWYRFGDYMQVSTYGRETAMQALFECAYAFHLHTIEKGHRDG